MRGGRPTGALRAHLARSDRLGLLCRLLLQVFVAAACQRCCCMPLQLLDTTAAAGCCYCYCYYCMPPLPWTPPLLPHATTAAGCHHCYCMPRLTARFHARCLLLVLPLTTVAIRCYREPMCCPYAAKKSPTHAAVLAAAATFLSLLGLRFYRPTLATSC